VDERFLPAAQRQDLWHGEGIDALFEWMRAYRPVNTTKWLEDKRHEDLR
jgi:hypothetical protein